MESMTTGQGRRPSPTTAPSNVGRQTENARSRQLEHRLTTLETKWDTVIPTLATKSDLLTLKSELKSDMHGLKGELKDEIHKLDVSMQTVLHKMEANMHKMEASIHRMDGSIKAWMLGTVVALLVGLGGLAVTVSKVQSPPAAKTAAATTGAMKAADGGEDAMKGSAPWNQ